MQHLSQNSVHHAMAVLTGATVADSHDPDLLEVAHWIKGTNDAIPHIKALLAAVDQHRLLATPARENELSRCLDLVRVFFPEA